MTTSLLWENKNLLAETYWESDSSAVSATRAKALKRQMIRVCRTVTYIQESLDENGKKKENHLYGYFNHQSMKIEPLALYIRMLFGDGFYYSELDNGSVYLLIIKDHIIVPGTDIFISKKLFNNFMEEQPRGHYKDLPLFKLTDEHMETILSHYNTNQKQSGHERATRFTTAVVISVIGVLLLILVIFLAWYLL